MKIEKYSCIGVLAKIMLPVDLPGNLPYPSGNLPERLRFHFFHFFPYFPTRERVEKGMGKCRTPNPKNGSGVFLDHLHHDLLPETFRDPSRMSVRFFCISLCWGLAWLRHPFPPNCHFPSGRPSGKPSGSFREPSGTAVFCSITFFHIFPRKSNFANSYISLAFAFFFAILICIFIYIYIDRERERERESIYTVYPQSISYIPYLWGSP